MSFTTRYTQSFSDWNSSGVAFSAEITERLSKMRNEYYAVNFSRQTFDSFVNVGEIVRKALPVSRVKCPSPRNMIVSIDDEETFFTIKDESSHSAPPWKIWNRDISLSGYGNLDLLTKVYAYVEEHITKNPKPVFLWEYANGKDRLRNFITPAKPKPIYNEFYPWIGDVNDYYDRYMRSESPVLVLLGPPGTAKTSFIRSMIWRDGLSVMFTYEESLLEHDAMFVDFLRGETDVLVVEDADTFLIDREHGGNRIMAKFLNISDGLVAPERRKKIIFTANLTEVNRIDQALLRPGRCFDCQIFRKLTASEAEAAARAASISFTADARHYTLAEIFAQAKGEPTGVQKAKIGVGR